MMTLSASKLKEESDGDGVMSLGHEETLQTLTSVWTYKYFLYQLSMFFIFKMGFQILKSISVQE